MSGSDSLRKVAVLGGTGFFGAYIVDELSRRGVKVVSMSREPPAKLPSDVEWVATDIADSTGLAKRLAGFAVVVHATGHFEGSEALIPLRVAFASKTDYVDMSEDRAMWRQVWCLAEQARAAGITAVPGMSVVPGLQLCIGSMLRQTVGPIHRLTTVIAPGTRRSRGPAMFHMMLRSAGQPFDGPSGRQVSWSRPEWWAFPAPIGRRYAYVAPEMADLDAIPMATGASSVVTRVGSEWALGNRAIAALGWLRVRSGGRIRPEWLSPLVRAGASAVGRFGSDAGGVIVEAEGSFARGRSTVIADGDGGCIPAMPAVAAVLWLLDERRLPGVASPTAVGWDRILRVLEERGLRVLNS